MDTFDDWTDAWLHVITCLGDQPWRIWEKRSPWDGLILFQVERCDAVDVIVGDLEQVVPDSRRISVPADVNRHFRRVVVAFS